MLSIEEFLQLAERDYKVCQVAAQYFPDEAAVSVAAYRIQQAIEKMLKGQLLLAGQNPPFTHNITKLADMCSQNGIDIPEFLDDITETLTIWESSARYDPYIVFSEKKYKKAIWSYNELHEDLRRKLNDIKGIEAEVDTVPDQDTPKKSGPKLF